MSQPTLRHQKGFTLIEVVVSLIIFGIMGSMLFAFLASSVVRSTEPVRMTQDLAQAQGLMETAVSAYNECLYSASPGSCWSIFKADHLCDPLTGDDLAQFEKKDGELPAFEICEVRIIDNQQVLVTYFAYE